VHTFVPGLPLTFLEYNLVAGDSLAGIGTLDEVSDMLDLDQTSLGMFAGGDSVMKQVRDDLSKLGDVADADAEHVQAARETREEINSRLAQVHARFDILAASRIDDELDAEVVADTDVEDVKAMNEYKQARETLEVTDPLHFPVAFPEVFDQERPGFDVIVGNPPWEKAKVEEHEFWARKFPGLRGLSSTQREARISELRVERPDLLAELTREQEVEQHRSELLTSGPFPGMGKGDPDMYKAFCWRFWHLVHEGGSVGAVLPRAAFIGPGTQKFRIKILNNGIVRDATFLSNKREWVFENVDPRYTIALFSFKRGGQEVDRVVSLRGPYADAESYERGVARQAPVFPAAEAKGWAGSATFPLLPADPAAVEVFEQMSKHPRLDQDEPGEWRIRPYRELDAANDKQKDDGTRLMHFTENPPDDYWPVYGGASFNLWTPDTGEYYAWADPAVMTEHLQDKRERSYQYAGSRSAFAEMDEEWVNDPETLDCYRPRIAFRDVTNRTNSRTLITNLIPGDRFMIHTAPYILWPRGNASDQAYLLGLLSSIPLDWYSRRFVETHVTYGILESLTVPRTADANPCRRRVIDLAGRLSAVDDHFSDWADAVGVEYGPLDEDTKQQMIYELDALVAHLYGLTREHVEVVFETFHRGWDYEERLAAVLEYYDSWAERLGPEHTHLTETAETDD